MSTESSDTSIALLSQKIDHYREESVNQRASINLQLQGIHGLLEVHVKNIDGRLDDHDERLTKNEKDISDVKVAAGEKTGAETARNWIMTTAIAGLAAFGTWVGMSQPHH